MMKRIGALVPFVAWALVGCDRPGTEAAPGTTTSAVTSPATTPPPVAAPLAAASAGPAATETGAARPADCASLCQDKSLGCPNDSSCLTQCAEFRSKCTALADAVIACNYSKPMSDFQCNPVSKATQVKPTVCSDELRAYMACLTK